MSKLKEIFEKKNGKVLNVYCTAGYPQLHSTNIIINTLAENGADIIELGMPYSDPLADGEVIQSSSSIALANGMTIEMLFQQLKDFKLQSPSFGGVGEAGIVLMGYMNPVLQFGFEKFCKTAAEVGVDGLIIPDLPEYEFETEYGAIIKKYGLDFIFLVTPETSEERVRKLDSLSTGFLYAVSSSSTTGSKTDFDAVEKYLQRLQSYQLTNPILVGFGVKDKESFNRVSQYTNGAIIGSAFIKALANSTNEVATTKEFLQSILN